MKQKDIALIIHRRFHQRRCFVVCVEAIFVSPKNRQQQVEVVQPITADFPTADSHYFNSTAFDPTKLITIGQNNNPIHLAVTRSSRGGDPMKRLIRQPPEQQVAGAYLVV